MKPHFPVDPSHCAQLEHPNTASFALALFLVVGLLVSYLPQHIRIISRKSSEGLSPYFVLLGSVSCTFGLFTILTLPSSVADIGCCKQISGYECFSAMLGIAQVATMWGSFSLM